MLKNIFSIFFIWLIFLTFIKAKNISIILIYCILLLNKLTSVIFESDHFLPIQVKITGFSQEKKGNRTKTTLQQLGLIPKAMEFKMIKEKTGLGKGEGMNFVE